MQSFLRSNSCQSRPLDAGQGLLYYKYNPCARARAGQKDHRFMAVLLINKTEDETRFALMRGDSLCEYSVERTDREEIIGNIYLARVERVDERHNACFVDFGSDRDGFCTFGDLPVPFDSGKPRIRRGDTIIIQVEREAVGSKGASVTGYVSLAGQYVVLTPDTETAGISRKVPDAERKRLAEIRDSLNIPDGIGIIMRTAASGATKTAITNDLKRLIRTWKAIQKEGKASKIPTLLYRETDPVIQVVRDLLGLPLDEVVVDDPSTHDKLKQYLGQVQGRKKTNLRLHRGRNPLFEETGAESQISQLSDRQVELPGGGSIVIDRTEALIAIDVNSGRTKGGQAEEVRLKTNLKAAEAIARQVILRDLGGIIVVDFIDLLKTGDRRKVEKQLKASMRLDRSQHRIQSIGPNGTLEMTRKRQRSVAGQLDLVPCPTCGGRGTVVASRTVAADVRRRLEARLRQGMGWVQEIRVSVPPHVANDLNNRFRSSLSSLEEYYRSRLIILADPRSVEVGEFEVIQRQSQAEIASEPRVQPATSEAVSLETSSPETTTSPDEKKESSSQKRRRRRKRKRKPGGSPNESTRLFLARMDEHGGEGTLMDELSQGLSLAESGGEPTAFTPPSSDEEGAA